MTGEAFEDIELEWHGKPYRIPANRVMEAIARVEDHLTLMQLQRAQERGGVPLAKLALAFSAVLRFAGASEVTSEQVYEGMFQENASEAIATSVVVLLSMMVPPARMKEIANSGAEGEARASTTRTKRSSKRLTRSRSSTANGAQAQSSGS